MKKILIISYFFPPNHSIAAQRFGTMYKYIKQNGYDPYVITANFKVNIDKNEESIDESHVIRIGGEEKELCNEVSKFQKLQGQVIAHSRVYLRSVQRESLYWYFLIRSSIEEIEAKIPKPDIIIGTYGPISNLYIARFLSKKWGIPWIAEVRDLISQYDETPKGFRHFKKADFLIEKNILNSSKALVVVTSGYKKIIQKYYKNEIAIIYNGWEKRQGNLEKKDLIKMPEKYIYYAGVLYKHRMKSFLMFLDALSLINKEYDLKLVIRMATEQKLWEELSSEIKSRNMDDMVVFLPECSAEQVNYESSHAMINLVLGDLSLNKQYLLTMVPGKVYELLPHGIPILAVTSKYNEMNQILTRTEMGIVADSKEKIYDFLLTDYKKVKGNSKEILYFSRENQAKILCEFLDKYFY